MLVEFNEFSLNIDIVCNFTFRFVLIIKMQIGQVLFLSHTLNLYIIKSNKKILISAICKRVLAIAKLLQ